MCKVSITSKVVLSPKNLLKGVLSLQSHHLLQGQNRSVRIRLIKLIEPPDTLNYNQFFKHCFVKIILHIFWFIFGWNKMFCLKIWAVLYNFFDLVWVPIWCYRFCVSGAFFVKLCGIRDYLATTDTLFWE